MRLMSAVVEHVKHMTATHPDAQPGGRGMSILNVGYGLGIVCVSYDPFTHPPKVQLTHSVYLTRDTPAPYYNN
jgi:hypothetical protein